MKKKDFLKELSEALTEVNSETADVINHFLKFGDMTGFPEWKNYISTRHIFSHIDLPGEEFIEIGCEHHVYRKN